MKTCEFIMPPRPYSDEHPEPCTLPVYSSRDGHPCCRGHYYFGGEISPITIEETEQCSNDT